MVIGPSERLGPFCLEIFLFLVVHRLQFSSLTSQCIAHANIIRITKFGFLTTSFVILLQFLQTVHGLTRTNFRHEAFNRCFLNNFFKGFHKSTCFIT
ncbi:hypothetical protein [Escherichia phage AnYang]|uniref:Uncharacterized protein n=1 Tax=Escherichia phage AnYang TaxID=2499909 RepID=A0A410T525_9CAUD|nr:hypothetical protein KNU29_gp122 [Escherichia phage AnYang]QAU03657.1 hypothetical protein [Escherichia phage AnYang]